jgi:hypothetical protein
MSLTDPTKKMSKSDPSSKSRILITDTRQTIFDKINGAVTDSEDGITYDPERRPGWANLIEIMLHLNDVHDYQTYEDVVRDWNTMSKRVAKTLVASMIDSHLAPIRQRYHELMSPETQIDLDDLERHGVSSALGFANRTMDRVKTAVGLQFGSSTLISVVGQRSQRAPPQGASRRDSSLRRVSPVRPVFTEGPTRDPRKAPGSQTPTTKQPRSTNGVQQGYKSSIPNVEVKAPERTNEALPNKINAPETTESIDSNSESTNEGHSSRTRGSERSHQWLQDLYV